MKLIQMKAVNVGTVVADAVSPIGEVNTGCIVHVDPASVLENGRYSDPLVTEDAAKKLEAGQFAVRVGEVEFTPGVPLSALGAITPINADVAAEQVAEFAEFDADGPGFGVSGLDTRDSVAHPDGARIRGGVEGLPGEGIEAGDEDAAPGADDGKKVAATKKAAAAG